MDRLFVKEAGSFVSSDIILIKRCYEAAGCRRQYGRKVVLEAMRFVSTGTTHGISTVASR